ncbi:hypothetical protein BDR05DRAFT_725322 [Suillus weaverae]|nr:hypothetical protein BDR05DRAFT_725322 [Suillus weaverae]
MRVARGAGRECNVVCFSVQSTPIMSNTRDSLCKHNYVHKYKVLNILRLKHPTTSTFFLNGSGPHSHFSFGSVAASRDHVHSKVSCDIGEAGLSTTQHWGRHGQDVWRLIYRSAPHPTTGYPERRGADMDREERWCVLKVVSSTALSCLSFSFLPLPFLPCSILRFQFSPM